MRSEFEVDLPNAKVSRYKANEHDDRCVWDGVVLKDRELALSMLAPTAHDAPIVKRVYCRFKNIEKLHRAVSRFKPRYATLGETTLGVENNIHYRVVSGDDGTRCPVCDLAIKVDAPALRFTNGTGDPAFVDVHEPCIEAFADGIDGVWDITR